MKVTSVLVELKGNVAEEHSGKLLFLGSSNEKGKSIQKLSQVAGNPRYIRGRVNLESVIHTDGWRGYNSLVDLGYKKHFRVHHGKSEFVRGKAHINGTRKLLGQC